MEYEIYFIWVNCEEWTVFTFFMSRRVQKIIVKIAKYFLIYSFDAMICCWTEGWRVRRTHINYSYWTFSFDCARDTASILFCKWRVELLRCPRDFQSKTWPLPFIGWTKMYNLSHHSAGMPSINWTNCRFLLYSRLHSSDDCIELKFLIRFMHQYGHLPKVIVIIYYSYII